MGELNLKNQCTNQLIEKIIESKRLTNCTVTNSKGCQKGDNYIGIVRSVNLNGRINDKDIEISLILKHAPTLPLQRSAFNCVECFQREFLLYEEILPMFAKFEAARCPRSTFKFAKLYATCKNEGCEVLALEDLKVLGYSMKNRRDQFNIDTYKAVMRTLAHLHSFSFALKDQQPEMFKKYRDINETVFCDRILNGQLLASTFDRVYQCLDDEPNEKVIEQMKFCENNFVKCFDYCLSSKETKKYGVLGHGDTWTNNIFFQHEDPTNPESPTSVCLVDWQITRYASPVLDIVYFLYSSTDGDFRDLHMEELFEEYYNELSKKLGMLGTVITKVFPYHAFRDEINKFKHFGALTAIMLQHIMLSSDVEAFGSDEIIEDRKRYEQVMLGKAKNDETYRRRMKRAINELCQKKRNELVPDNC